jgi:hypothetical protein
MKMNGRKEMTHRFAAIQRLKIPEDSPEGKSQFSDCIHKPRRGEIAHEDWGRASM